LWLQNSNMNILIESGATKSTCIGYKDRCTFFIYKTVGINATYAKKEEIYAVFQDIIVKNRIAAHEIEKINYYGAGCFNENNAKKVKEVLTSLFPNAAISVFSDLHAACHALCKAQKGFVGILGTGAASCLYDGVKIVDKAPSLGYLLGDEGSGAYLGKQFLTHYLNNKIKPEIAQDFEETFSVTKQRVFAKVYQTAHPQNFFASIPIFLHKHLEKEQIESLVVCSFQVFFDKQIEYYKKMEYPWFFCGSIAYYFQDILNEVAYKNHIEIGKIVQECALVISQDNQWRQKMDMLNIH